MTVATGRTYGAFDLRVHSAFEFPPLESTTPPSDADTVEFRRGRVDAPAALADREGPLRTESGDVYVEYDVATVLVRDGRLARVDPSPDAPQEILTHALLGPVLNHLIHQRGLFVLHASTVAIDGRAVAFLGDSGQGKTTMAMAALAEGHRVLSDDVAAVDAPRETRLVRSGYPAIKLAPAVVDAFDVDLDPAPGASSVRDRHFHPLRASQFGRSGPLARLYLLTDGDDIGVEPVRGGELVTELVANTYTNALLSGGDPTVRNFRRCEALARSVPTKRLERPRRLDALGQVIEAVETDLEGDAS